MRRRRRWPAFVVGTIAVLILAAMLGAAVFHTQLAERQLEIDRLDSIVEEERRRYDELRLARAQLRAPTRLAPEAGRLGMVLTSESRYIGVDPWSFARQLAAAGAPRDGVGQIIVESGPFDEFREIKAATEQRP